MWNVTSTISRKVAVTALAVVLLDAAFFGSAARAEGERTGWHGETMPEGLVRGEKDGEYVWEKDGSVMVYVPAGEFIMGSDDGEMDERPQRTVWLDSYYIDKYEVTWKQWRMGENLPQLRDIDGGPIVKFKPVWGRGDHLPVSYVKWTDAKAYADWVGKRLPTEAEWEKAARGSDGRSYPWGDEEPDIERAVWQEHPIGKDEPAPVRCCESGASPYGVVNMVGNIFEWCEDWYGRAYYRNAPDKNPVNREEPKSEPYKVLRGASFTHAAEDLRVTLRNRQWPEEGQDYVGFRLALTAVDDQE